MPTPSCGRSGGSIHHPPPPPSAATAAAATTTSASTTDVQQQQHQHFLTLGRPIFTTFFLEEKNNSFVFFGCKNFREKVYFLSSAESPKKNVSALNLFSAESLALSNKFTCCTKNHLEVVNYCYSQWGWRASTNVDFMALKKHF